MKSVYTHEQIACMVIEFDHYEPKPGEKSVVQISRTICAGIKDKSITVLTPHPYCKEVLEHFAAEVSKEDIVKLIAQLRNKLLFD